MPRSKPPFRADHVGSLLRPAALKEAQERAEALARKRAAEKAEKEREAKARAAREAERKLLNTYVSPISGSYISTGYKAGGAVWSSGSHTGIDFHASSGTAVRSATSSCARRTRSTGSWDGATASRSTSAATPSGRACESFPYTPARRPRRTRPTR